MQHFNQLIRFGSIAAMCGLLAACGGNDDKGTLSVQLTDAPVDNATSVVIEVSGMLLQGPNGREEFEFDEARSIDLLDLTGNTAETLLDGIEVTAGQYQWMRLNVNADASAMDSYVELDNGMMYSLWIPSGDQTGLKVNVPFAVPAGGEADFTIDFDVRKSLHSPGSSAIDYILRPTLRLVDNAVVGNIEGTVSNSLANVTDCSPAVYLYEGADMKPDDIDGDEGDPLTSATPELDPDTSDYDYTIGFVAEGDYTVTFTCDAGIEDPASDDALTFQGTQNVTVVASETATADFN